MDLKSPLHSVLMFQKACSLKDHEDMDVWTKVPKRIQLTHWLSLRSRCFFVHSGSPWHWQELSRCGASWASTTRRGDFCEVPLQARQDARGGPQNWQFGIRPSLLRGESFWPISVLDHSSSISSALQICCSQFFQASRLQGFGLLTLSITLELLWTHRKTEWSLAVSGVYHWHLNGALLLKFFGTGCRTQTWQIPQLELSIPAVGDLERLVCSSDSHVRFIPCHIRVKVWISSFNYHL